MSTIASTVLKSTELHGGKGNFPYKIKINKHYFKIIYDLEVLKDTRSSPGKRMNVKPEYVTGYLTLHINILTIRNTSMYDKMLCIHGAQSWRLLFVNCNVRKEYLSYG